MRSVTTWVDKVHDKDKNEQPWVLLYLKGFVRGYEPVSRGILLLCRAHRIYAWMYVWMMYVWLGLVFVFVWMLCVCVCPLSTCLSFILTWHSEKPFYIGSFNCQYLHTNILSTSAQVVGKLSRHLIYLAFALSHHFWKWRWERIMSLEMHCTTDEHLSVILV